MSHESCRLDVNGAPAVFDGDPLTPLRSVLGEMLGLRSVREPCGVGACGACTVLVDGRPVKSCLIPVGLVAGSAVTTAEGLPSDDPVVGAFVARNAFQCGYCIPGFVMAVHGLRSEGGRVPDPPDAPTIREALTGNLCRCGSYGPILEAARDVLDPGPRAAG
jgi:aerobic-type carbon monoxide dehydrogenase small subunit (CoxS/CutS family)